MTTLIRQGTLVDGTGAPPVRSDLFVADGRIAALGADCPAVADRIIEARDRLVTPGFVDIHRHADARVFSTAFGEIELRQGITTAINGNCGLSAAPAPGAQREQIHAYLKPLVGAVPDRDCFGSFGRYLGEVEALPLPLNWGCCVGNGTLRMAAKGFAPGPLSREEMAAVHGMLEEALDASALGVSLGLAYSPESCYTLDELEEALEPVRGRDITLATHIRGEGDILVSAIEEVAELADRLGVRLHVSHLKAVGRQNWGGALDRALEVLQRARDRGMRVSVDVYPYTAGSSQLLQLMPPWVAEGGVDRAVERLRDPAHRQAITRELAVPQTGYENILLSVGWNAIVITSAGLEQHREYLGKTVAQIARERGQDPYECAYDLLADERCDVSMVNFVMDEADVVRVMRDSHSCIISDALYAENGVPHPRLHASFTRFLAHYVRDRKIMSLESAVAKLTSVPAAVYGLRGKGILAPGMDADLCVFDLEALSNPSDYGDSTHLSRGFDWVLVGGEAAVQNDRCTGARPGRLLRRLP